MASYPNTPPRRNIDADAAPVPPASVPSDPVEEPHPEPVPSADVEKVYDYTQGGDQPEIYERAKEETPPAAPAPQEPVQPEPVPPQQPVAAPQRRAAAAAPRPAAAPKTKTKMGLDAPPQALSRRKKALTQPKGAPPRVAGARRSAYRPNPVKMKPVSSGGGVASVLMMIVAVILLIIGLMVMSPSNLKPIKGYVSGARSLEEKETRNLLGVAQQALITNEDVVFSEAEVNRYLATRLKGHQTGVFGSMIKFRGVCVDFRPNVAEIYIERTFVGFPVTMSSRVKFDTSGNRAGWKSAGGRIGKFNLNSDKHFAPVLEAFLRLAKTCNEEVDIIDKMTNVKFLKNKMILDPR